MLYTNNISIVFVTQYFDRPICALARIVNVVRLIFSRSPSAFNNRLLLFYTQYSRYQGHLLINVYNIILYIMYSMVMYLWPVSYMDIGHTRRIQVSIRRMYYNIRGSRHFLTQSIIENIQIRLVKYYIIL